MPDPARELNRGFCQEAFRFGAIETRMDAGYVIERLRNPHPARQNSDIGDEADVAHKWVALGPGVAAKNSQLTLILGEAENRVERRALAGAVGADNSQDAAFLDMQVGPGERNGCAEGLAQAAGFDHFHFFGSFFS